MLELVFYLTKSSGFRELAKDSESEKNGKIQISIFCF